MQLHYLDFDFSEDELGHACWDALACVPPERWEALLAEAQALLAWCEQQGGPAGDMDAGFGWDFDLQATAEKGEQTTPIAITWAAPVLQANWPPRWQHTLLSGPEHQHHTSLDKRLQRRLVRTRITIASLL